MTQAGKKRRGRNKKKIIIDPSTVVLPESLINNTYEETEEFIMFIPLRDFKRSNHLDGFGTVDANAPFESGEVIHETEIPIFTSDAESKKKPPKAKGFNVRSVDYDPETETVSILIEPGRLYKMKKEDFGSYFVLYGSSKRLTVKAQYNNKNNSSYELVKSVEREYNPKVPELNDGSYVCWWDGHPFVGPVIPMPKDHKRDSFKVKGCFCSYNCALAYIEAFEQSAVNRYKSLLSYFYKKMSGDNSYPNILPAGPLELLRVRGGSMEIDEYRQSFRKRFERGNVSLEYTNEYIYTFPRPEVATS